MKTTVTILKDIQLRKDSHVFHRRTAQIEYDSQSPRHKKLHQLIFQQGDHYGTIGDCCDYLTHDLLLDLERGGFVRINGRIGR